MQANQAISQPVVVEVEMHAFMAGEVRPVRIPAREAEAARGHDVELMLGLAFQYGQNDFQSVPGFCSVSVGDIIRYDGKRYRVEPIGFIEIGAREEEVSLACRHDLHRRCYGASNHRDEHSAPCRCECHEKDRS